MDVRKFRPGEELELWQLFFDTVHAVNSRDYTAEQVAAWAPPAVDAEEWRARVTRNSPFVCVANGALVGFADVQETGYIEQFFVHHLWQRRGVGTRLLSAIESTARERCQRELFSNVSITARPFFESRGFVVETVQTVQLGAETLQNFRMRKWLEPSPGG